MRFKVYKRVLYETKRRRGFKVSQTQPHFPSFEREKSAKEGKFESFCRLFDFIFETCREQMGILCFTSSVENLKNQVSNPQIMRN